MVDAVLDKAGLLALLNGLVLALGCGLGGQSLLLLLDALGTVESEKLEEVSGCVLARQRNERKENRKKKKKVSKKKKWPCPQCIKSKKIKCVKCDFYQTTQRDIIH